MASVAYTSVIANGTYQIPQNATSVTINGVGFAGGATVQFNDGAAGMFSSVNGAGTKLVFNLNQTGDQDPIIAGPLTAVVTSGGVSTGLPQEVAEVAPRRQQQ